MQVIRAPYEEVAAYALTWQFNVVLPCQSKLIFLMSYFGVAK
jgi:hypothetical protein